MNTKLTNKLMLACSLFTASYSAHAGGADDLGFYFGVGASQSSLDANQANMSLAYGSDPQSSFETNGLGLSLVAGLSMDEYLSFEASYTELGSIALDNGTTQVKMFDADIFNVSALLSYPVNEKVDVFGRLGLSYWSTLDENVDTLESGSGLVYGAGMDVNVYGNKSSLGPGKTEEKSQI